MFLSGSFSDQLLIGRWLGVTLPWQIFSLFTSFDLFISNAPYVGLVLSLIFLMSLQCIRIYSELWHYLIISLENSLFSLAPFQWSKGFIEFCATFMGSLFLLNASSIGAYVFPLTSQLGLVLLISCIFWLSVNIFCFVKFPSSFLCHLTPLGSPLYLGPFLVLIEVVRSLIRPITLTVRLVANVLAGHVLIILLYSLVDWTCYFSYPLYVGLTVVECLVSAIQSYIFVVLFCLYFSEV